MLPEEHMDKAENPDLETKMKIYHATMAVAGFLSQMEICGHGTRGFCKDCVRHEFLSYPISVREAGKNDGRI